MTELEFDFANLLTIRQVLEEGVAFTEGTIRHWLFNRDENGLASAVVKIQENILFDVAKFNAWFSGEGDFETDFRDLRTKDQIVQSTWITTGRLEHWLRHRDCNGLADAVFNQYSRRLYIDIQKFNNWLLRQNQNNAFGGAF